MAFEVNLAARKIGTLHRLWNRITPTRGAVRTSTILAWEGRNGSVHVNVADSYLAVCTQGQESRISGSEIYARQLTFAGIASFDVTMGSTPLEIKSMLDGFTAKSVPELIRQASPMKITGHSLCGIGISPEKKWFTCVPIAVTPPPNIFAISDCKQFDKTAIMRNHCEISFRERIILWILSRKIWALWIYGDLSFMKTIELARILNAYLKINNDAFSSPTSQKKPFTRMASSSRASSEEKDGGGNASEGIADTGGGKGEYTGGSDSVGGAMGGEDSYGSSSGSSDASVASDAGGSSSEGSGSSGGDSDGGSWGGGDSYP